jgi:hypothetical protein
MTRSTLIHDAQEPRIASGQDAERRRRDVTCIIFTFAPQFVTAASRLLPTKTLPELLLLCGIYCGRVQIIVIILSIFSRQGVYFVSRVRESLGVRQ